MVRSSTIAAAMFVAILGDSVSANPLQKACSAFQDARRAQASADSVPSGPPDVNRVSVYLQQAEALGFTGGVVMSRGGRTILRETYGFADRDGGRPLRSDAVIDIGSITKQFTAAAILRLEETGRLRVTDSISRFFPDAPADKRAITIHQLLTHTSGLPHDAVSRDELLSRDEGVRRIMAASLSGAPGERYAYSNAGYVLLAAIVELASGRGYENYLRDQLWRPAGLRNTGNLLPRYAPSQFALGYNAAGGSRMPPLQWWIDDGPSWSVRGAGYVLSTADDMVRWADALVAGRILSRESRRKLFHPHVHERTRRPSYYGYGWVISAAPDGTCVVSHDGGQGFHADVLRIYPQHGLVTFYFTSESRSPAFLFMGGAGRALFAPPAELPIATAQISERQIHALTGSYETPNGALSLEATGSALTIRSRLPGALRLLSVFPDLAPPDRAMAEGLEARVPSLFRSLSQADYSVLVPILRPTTPLAEEQDFWPRQWRLWRGDFGAFRSTEIIGHQRRGDDLVTYVQLHFERSALPIEIFQDRDGKIAIGTVSVTFPERTHLLPQMDGSFLAYNARLASGVRLRIDDRGRRLLVVSTCVGADGCRSSEGASANS